MPFIGGEHYVGWLGKRRVEK